MKRFFQHFASRQGFSLIEVNMAIFVLAGGALALLGLFPLGLRESLAARNEMRVTAFCERFLGAARVVADKPGVKDYDTLLDALEGDFSYHIEDDMDERDTVRAHEDPKNSGVWYRAWSNEPTVANGSNIETVRDGDVTRQAVEICVQATAEDCRKNTRPLANAPVYSVWVYVTSVNKE